MALLHRPETPPDALLDAIEGVQSSRCFSERFLQQS